MIDSKVQHSRAERHREKLLEGRYDMEWSALIDSKYEALKFLNILSIVRHSYIFSLACTISKQIRG